MKIATWNINGIRARQERLVAWLTERAPDVVCLQETKIDDSQFEPLLFRELGYEVVYRGQKAYNGVAILSRRPLSDVEIGFGDPAFDHEARLITASVSDIRVTCAYFPNGKEVGCEKYDHKLAWMARLRTWLADRVKPETPWILCGDFNVAPEDLDVHDPEAWLGRILCSQPERDALDQIRQVGFQDAFRSLYPTTPGFTWWDYRQLGFQMNKGLRIDLALVTPSLLSNIDRVDVDREARKGKQASDHAPLVVELGAEP